MASLQLSAEESSPPLTDYRSQCPPKDFRYLKKHGYKRLVCQEFVCQIDATCLAASHFACVGEELIPSVLKGPRLLGLQAPDAHVIG